MREFTIADYEAAAGLWENTDGVCTCDKCNIIHKKENIKNFLERNPELSYVALVDGEVVGTILCGHDCRTGMIYRLTVSEKHRKKSIGKKLVERSIAQLKSQGIITVKIFVLNDNAPGNLFWEKVGFGQMENAVTRECDLY